MKPKKNRQYKDSVFVDLFSKDDSVKANFISLYNALHGSKLTIKNTRVEQIVLDQVLYMGFHNDVSCLVNDKIIVLVEHQSTVNENMPLRFLQYIGRLYEKITGVKDRYAYKLKKIPAPEFFVLYNGTETYPEVKTLKLSDAFFSAPFLDKRNTQGVNLELTVKVLNINSGRHGAVLERCPALRQYSFFVDSVRKNIKADPKNGFENAIAECMNNNVLREYLERKATEVRNMLFAEYDYETDIAVKREEAWESGVEHGLKEKALEDARNFKKLGVSTAIIAEATGLTAEEIDKM